eukprot:GAHX01006605.1.p1 GENE.GAHX01006605.1~~GAHX01006605.1.p1  ORF type:complete len:60 (+),score=0.49 GAHX01006605.1:49-228(+)
MLITMNDLTLNVNISNKLNKTGYELGCYVIKSFEKSYLFHVTNQVHIFENFLRCCLFLV